MKLREIPIPTGCTRVSVEQENDKIVILFEGNNKEWVPEAEKYPYKASNEEWYSHAIRFRNLSQFVKIIKHRFRNAQKNK